MRLKDVDRIRKLFDEKFTETRKLILEGETHLNNLAEGFKEAEDVILEMPTIDAVPVVRCCQCKNGIVLQHSDFVVCHRGRMKQMDFCSYGERKDGD